MRYYRLEADRDARVVVTTDDGTAYDLTSARDSVSSFRDLARAADITDREIDEVAEGLVDSAEELDLDAAVENVTTPVVAEEVWAAGVTYQISQEAREAESSLPEIYRNVYESERPEVFFKSTPSRTVGPGEDVGIRADSEWDVPEPELAVVLHRGEIVGYTIGNDMSSRDIEGQNALYLPQAKIYDRSCAIGPCITSPSSIDDPHDLEMTMAITRDGEQVFEGSTTTANMAESCQKLVDYYARHNTLPEVAVLLTGTAIVPEDSFTLQPEDSVRIEIENVGVLENDVRLV